MLGKVRKASRKVTGGDGKPSGGISPNPLTNLVIADLALRIGGQLLAQTVERGVLGRKVGAGKAKKIIKGRTMGQALLGTAIVRVATRSVPGAIVVGGGLIAKTLYDRRRAGAASATAAKSDDDGE